MPLTMPDFIKKESIVPIKKLQDFTFLDRDDFLAKQDVDALAKKAAKDNLPATSSSRMDANELVFIADLGKAATAATMTLNGSLSDIYRGITTIDVEAEKAELDNAINKIEAELKKAYEGQVAELEEYKTEASLRQDDLDKFKKEHRLTMEAKPEGSIINTIAIILSALVIETMLNSNLLADASSFGLIGGAIMAITISAINIVIGFSNHIGKARATIAYICLTFGALIIFVFNLLIGHYREVLLENPDSSGVAAVSQFTEGMFNLTSIESIFLVFIGLIVSGLSYWKGMSQNDKYPGYSQVTKLRDSSRAGLYEAKEDALEDLNAISDDCEENLQKLLKKVTVDYSRCTALYSMFDQQQRLYESYISDLFQTGEIALSRYRQVNLSNRNDDAPAYFDKEIKIDFKQNPTIPELPDIKHKLNEVVENFGSRIPSLKIEFARVVEGYRKKIGAIEL
jgi:hypothetical protein